MCNKDHLVSFLYDDLDGAARTAFERHLHDCAECRDELQAMRAVRADLLTWAPPEPDFAFRIVSEPRAAQGGGNVLRPVVPSWRAWFTPAAGFAAAAVLVLAAAAGLARVEVHSGPDGWTLRTGGGSESAVTPQSAQAGFGGTIARDVRLAAPGADGMSALAALEQRITALESATRQSGNVRNAAASGLSARASDAEILKVVRELLAQSENRQKGELALRMAQVIRDMDMKRNADLNGVRMGLGKIDASVTEEVAAHRELMNYFLTNAKQK
jgi:hypothetical protein